MQRPTLLALAALLFAAALHARSPLDHARHAQALLGPEVWSRVIRIDNLAPDRRYPKKIYALIFELQGLLWFYTATDGTQSLSLHRNNLAAEKADLLPLLRAIEPGFTRWRAMPDAEPNPRRRLARLRNGCFIESLAALRRRLLRGAPTEDPKLLAYYDDLPEGRRGHTVLAYSVAGRLEIFDPDRPERIQVVPEPPSADPLALARKLEGKRIGKARYLPVDLAAPELALMAAAGANAVRAAEAAAAARRS